MSPIDYIDYANRFNEFNAIENSFFNRNNAVFLIAGHAYGVTSFLKTFCKRKNDYAIDTFYISVSQDKCFIELLLEKIIRSPYLDDLQKMIDKNYGNKNETMLTSASKTIPYAGEFLSYLF